MQSRGDEAYELAGPLGGSRSNVGNGLEMRKYRRGGDSSSEVTLSDGKTGIMKTTDISVGYSSEPMDGRSGKAASVDSIV